MGDVSNLRIISYQTLADSRVEVCTVANCIQTKGGIMNGRKESKAREVDRQTREKGKWTGIGFVVIVIGIAVAVLLLILGTV